MNNPRDEEIVKLAYSMAVGTHRFQDMFGLLEQRFTSLTDETSANAGQLSDSSLQPEFDGLEPHFEQAHALMDSQGRRTDTATHSMKVIDADSQPSALLDQDGRIFYENKAAAELFGFERGTKPDEILFERGHYKKLMANLKAIDGFDANKIINIFGISSQDGEEIVKVALTKAYGSDGRTLGYISAINISWQASTAKQFQSLFGLTPVEVEITRAVVNGVSLKELATRRKRSLGTVRNQKKMLLAKLNLRSQTELACLYSGFSKYNGALSEVPITPEKTGYAAKTHLLLRDDGRVLDFRTAGPEDGRPLILIPALLGGTAITQSLHESLFKFGFKLIMPWRPGLGDTSFSSLSGEALFRQFSEDIASILDRHNVDAAPIIGTITGAPFAIAAKKYLPDRIRQLFCINGIVPTVSGPHLKLIDKRERMRMFLMRSAPKVGRMVMHAAMSLVDSGYDMEFMREHLLESPLDLKTADIPEIKHLFRADFRDMTKHGYDGFTNELAVAASDWNFLFDGLEDEVRYIVGEENLYFTPDVVRAFANDKPNIKIDIVDQTAHLALYQDSESILKIVDGVLC